MRLTWAKIWVLVLFFAGICFCGWHSPIPIPGNHYPYFFEHSPGEFWLVTTYPFEDSTLVTLYEIEADSFFYLNEIIIPRAWKLGKGNFENVVCEDSTVLFFYENTRTLKLVVSDDWNIYYVELPTVNMGMPYFDLSYAIDAEGRILRMDAFHHLGMGGLTTISVFEGCSIACHDTLVYAPDYTWVLDKPYFKGDSVEYFLFYYTGFYHINYFRYVFELNSPRTFYLDTVCIFNIGGTFLLTRFDDSTYAYSLSNAYYPFYMNELGFCSPAVSFRDSVLLPDYNALKVYFYSPCSESVSFVGTSRERIAPGDYRRHIIQGSLSLDGIDYEEIGSTYEGDIAIGFPIITSDSLIWFIFRYDASWYLTYFHDTLPAFSDTNLIYEKVNTPSKVSIRTFPNPFNSSVKLEVIGISETNLRIEIYNIYGKLISELITSKSSFCVWNGTDNSGKEIHSGIYFLLIRGKNGNILSNTKIIHLK